MPQAPVFDEKSKDKKGYDEEPKGEVTVSAATDDYLDSDLRPSDEDNKTLRKVAAPLPWVAIAMCLIEFAERASYYGSSGPFNNFSGSFNHADRLRTH